MKSSNGTSPGSPCAARNSSRDGGGYGAGSALQWAITALELQKVEPTLDDWLARETNPPLFLNGVSGLGAEAHARRCAEYWRSIAAQHSVDLTAWPAQISEAV